MKIADAEAALRAAALELPGLPLKLATAVHAKAAGKATHEVKADTWADLRAAASDPEDLPALEKPVAALAQAIADINQVIASI